MFVVVIFVCMTVRAAVGTFPYSGERDSPKFGDYEAQRHWMEITLHLSPSQWYSHSPPQNDLEYWGLDYPPLSAYISWLFSHLIRFSDPPAMALLTSHGHESEVSRAAMRMTVLLADVFVLFPALALFASALNTRASKPQQHYALMMTVVCAVVFAPALILIDHGHFQYNNVSLGLFTACVACFAFRYDHAAAVLFCCSIAFKQMSLYYALPIACFYLATAAATARQHNSVWRSSVYLLSVAFVVFLTLGVLFLPWITSRRRLLEVFARLFPTHRGLYEDKVASVWCSLSLVGLKLNNFELLSRSQVVSLCLISTLASCLPFCAALLIPHLHAPHQPQHQQLRFERPPVELLLLCSAGCALSFYLWSFHVHEKQVLLPLVPILLLSHHLPQVSLWTTLIASFSMYPLLSREKLATPYFALQTMYLLAFRTLPPRSISSSSSCFSSSLPPITTTTAAVVVPSSMSSRVIVACGEGRAEEQSALCDDDDGDAGALLRRTWCGDGMRWLRRMVETAQKWVGVMCMVIHVADAVAPRVHALPDIYTYMFTTFSCTNLLAIYATLITITAHYIHALRHRHNATTTLHSKTE